jgi:hypothetical protein
MRGFGAYASVWVEYSNFNGGHSNTSVNSIHADRDEINRNMTGHIAELDAKLKERGMPPWMPPCATVRTPTTMLSMRLVIPMSPAG